MNNNKYYLLQLGLSRYFKKIENDKLILTDSALSADLIGNLSTAIYKKNLIIGKFKMNFNIIEL